MESVNSASASATLTSAADNLRIDDVTHVTPVANGIGKKDRIAMGDQATTISPLASNINPPFSVANSGPSHPQRGVVSTVPPGTSSTTTDFENVGCAANDTTDCNKEVLADATNDSKPRNTSGPTPSKIAKGGSEWSTMNVKTSSTTGNIVTAPLPPPSPSVRSLKMNSSTASSNKSLSMKLTPASRSYEDVAVFATPPNAFKTSPGAPAQVPIKPRDSSKSTSKSKETWQISPQNNSSTSKTNGSSNSQQLPALESDQFQFQPPLPSNAQQQLIILRSDPDQQDQALFESRLTEDPFGVAIRKINHSGKAQLRYVRCIPLSSSPHVPKKSPSVASSTASSVLSRRKKVKEEKGSNNSAAVASNAEDDCLHYNLLSTTLTKRRRALTWGHKTKVVVALEKFTCVRKGKTTDRTRKCPSPSCQLLSVLTDDPDVVLDIEAPTKSDRDKFAQAFARFLSVPLEAEVDASVTVDGTLPVMRGRKNKVGGGVMGSAQSAPGETAAYSRQQQLMRWNSSVQIPSLIEEGKEKNLPAFAVSSSHQGLTQDASATTSLVTSLTTTSPKNSLPTGDPAPSPVSDLPQTAITTTSPSSNKMNVNNEENDDDQSSQHSTVSSITAGLEHEIVDELHQVIQDLRAELEASRAEAARAVKVAEQAIQSAENCSSKDWNSTVTHKAAEAAAQAQKRSAEAMARQRLAEEKLATERRATAFWRRQAEAAEEDAGVLQTRAAAAEVQRASVQQVLQMERERVGEQLAVVKGNLVTIGARQKRELDAVRHRNRALEIALERTRLDLAMKWEESKSLNDRLMELKMNSQEGTSGGGGKMKLKLGKIGGKKRAIRGLSDQDMNGSSAVEPGNLCLLADPSSTGPPLLTADLLTAQLRREAMELRNQFELFRVTTADEIKSLPDQAKEWTAQVSQALLAAHSETMRLRERLAKEGSMRRKLHHKVQDQRGTVRVYCRPRPPTNQTCIISVPSHDTLVVHQDKISGDKKDGGGTDSGGQAEESGVMPSLPIGFEFDRVFSPQSSQGEVYEEVESLVLDVLDGYSVCIMSYGQTGSGKTFTLLGDIDNLDEEEKAGVHLNAVRHLFAVAEKRSERYQDSFSITILEVHEDRLFDMIAGTATASKYGEPVSAEAPLSKKRSRSKRHSEESNTVSTLSTPQKLEIKTNFDGDTVVQGLISVPISCPMDVSDLWHECLAQRKARLGDQNKGLASHLAKSHIFFTVSVTSTNIATGVSSVGKLQSVDLAGSDLVPSGENASKPISSVGVSIPLSEDWSYADKSLTTLSEVVEAKCQFLRTVPYRNSTLTHLLRDSIEGDAKVLMFCCINSEAEYVQQTKEALRFASRMRRVSVGVATKRTIAPTVSPSN